MRFVYLYATTQRYFQMFFGVQDVRYVTLERSCKKRKKAKRDCFQMNPKQNISQAIKLLGN